MANAFYLLTFSLYVIRPYAIKVLGRGGVDFHLHAFLISVPDGDKWSASRPDHSTSGETDPIKTE